MFLLFCSVELGTFSSPMLRPVDQNEGGRGLQAECASENLSVNLRRNAFAKNLRAILSGLSGGHDCGALELILNLSGLSMQRPECTLPSRGMCQTVARSSVGGALNSHHGGG